MLTDWILWTAVAANLVFAACWMSWQPSHHDALASMMGWERRGRPPLIAWRRLLKHLRIVGRAAGAGVFALREIASAVMWAIIATVVSAALTIVAFRYAIEANLVEVTLGGQPASQFDDIAIAIVSHLVATRLHEAFEFTQLPTAEFRGDYRTSILMLSLVSVVTVAGLRALAEWIRCVWYALVCILAPDSARNALSGEDRGVVWTILGKPT